MKILRITESQYKSLIDVVDPLSPYNNIIFNREEDKNELSGRIIDFLDDLSYFLGDTVLYIDKIEDGVVYIDFNKYEDEKIKYLINSYIEWYVDEFDVNDSAGNFFYDSGETKKEENCSCMDKQNPEIAIRYDCNDMMPIECQELEVNTLIDNSSDIRQKIVDKAYSKLGEPYVWGGEFCTKGGDCSGLIDWTLNNVSGIESPYSGRETSKVLKRLVKNKNKGKKIGLGKGDILVFNPPGGGTIGHVGFVYDVNNNNVDMIDSASGVGVRILKDVFASGLNSRYYGAIPIVNGKYESN